MYNTFPENVLYWTLESGSVAFPQETAKNTAKGEFPMPITKPIVSEIAAKTYVINEFGLNAMFLIEGSDRALVLDTGSGFCDFKEILRDLTKKPYLVALTHGHVDHAGGAGQFDRLYLHPADWEMAKGIAPEERLSYGEAVRGVMGDPNTFAYGKDTLRVWDAFPELLPIQDGQTFDLGDRTISVVHTPGHTPGSCCFIDPKTRILFSGDAENSNLLLPWGTVSTALRGLLKLKTHEEEWDRSYNGHIGYSGHVDCLSQPDSMLDDCIAALRSILDGTGRVKTYSGFLGRPQEMHAVSFGRTRVTFSPDRLWEEGEAQELF